MIHETAHTETFIIDDAVAEVHAINAEVNHLGLVQCIIIEDSVSCSRNDFVMVNDKLEGILGIVDSIGIHVRALEEVDTDRRRLGTIGFRFTTTINIGTIVTIAETTSDIAAHIVVLGIAEVDVSPRREVGTGQGIGGTVDDLIAIESHVVDFVVRGEGKCLGTHFDTNSLATRFGVGSTFIIEDPPQGLVTLQHLVGQNGAVHRTVSFLLHGRNLGVAEFIGNVIVRIVTLCGVILAITVSIVERSQIVSDVVRVTYFMIGVSGPVLDDGRNHGGVNRTIFIPIREELVNLSAGDLENLIPTSTGFGSNGGLAIDGQRTREVVVTNLTETQGGALQLVINVDTGNPKGTGIQ